jgi:putative ABC transport system permease protein
MTLGTRTGLFGDLTPAHGLVAAHVDVPLDAEPPARGGGPTRRAPVSALKAVPGLGVRGSASPSRC